MFEPMHFVWLAISIIIIVAMLLITKKLKLNNNVCLSIMCIMIGISEIVKIFSNIITSQSENGGAFLDPKALPFHLCSIQIFFLFSLKFFIKNESTRKTLYNFMVPSSIIGATMSLLIPTNGTSFATLDAYQYFICHAFLIFYGFYLIREGIAILDFKASLTNICLLLLLVVFNLWINSILSIYDTNFMFLTYPPMENLPILNLNHGWKIYFIILVCIGFILMILFHLPFVLIERKRKLRELA